MALMVSLTITLAGTNGNGFGNGGTPQGASSADSTGPENVASPMVTIHSTGDVTRGKTGSFVLSMNSPSLFPGTYVNFKVSGTAVPGVDYVAVVSPALLGGSGYGVISIKTLPDPRGSYGKQKYSVVVTLEPGPGYAVGASSSAAKMWIEPPCTNCQ